MTTSVQAVSGAARPQLLRALNEQLLLKHIRQVGRCSRAELARFSGLSKPTVSLALANVERAGLVREAGQQTGALGRSAVLYEVRPDAGYVLGLDIGRRFVRGAVADLAGNVLVRSQRPVRASSTSGRVAELVSLADDVCAASGVSRTEVTQTVIGSPGVYDPSLGSILLPGGIAGWGRPAVIGALHEAFGSGLVVENDVDAATLAEQEHGHGRDVDTFAFVSIGTGIGMGLVIRGDLHRGAHGVAGEIAYLPISAEQTDPGDARRRGQLEAAACATAVVRAGRRAGLRGPLSARRVFTAAAAGDPAAAAIVAAEAAIVARAVCAVVTVVDPEMVVLGGGIGQAPGFAAAVAARLSTMAPAMPEVRVSALGTESVVDGCLAAGAELAWQQLSSLVP